MRIHKLLATVLAAGLVFSGCHQDEDYLLPDIEINAESLDFSDDTELKISLTASRDWLVRSKPDWVAVDPDHGSASSAPQRVVISVLPNNDYNRTGEVLFTIGLDKAAVEVIQPGAKGEKPRGSGTLEDPYTVGGVLDYVKSLGADVESPQDVYIKGKIASVTEAYSSQFGNGTFVIRGESADETFTVYRALYLGNKKWTDKDTQIKEGDDVIVCGKVIYFKGNTPETQQNKAYLYSLNGEVREAGSAGTPSGEGTLDKPYNVAGVLNYINTLGADVESPSEVYISGEIAEVTEAYSSNFGNGTFTIKDADADAVFTVYRALYLGNQKYADGNTQIKVGDKVVVCGKVINYKGNTPETQQNKAYLYSLNGTTAGGSSSGGEQGGGSGTEAKSGSGTLEDPYTVGGAVEYISGLAADAATTENVYIKGKISSINEEFSAQYGNGTFYITDDSGATFYVFRTMYLGNAKWTANDTQIKTGDEVVICGQVVNYKGNTPETVANKSYIYSLNGETRGSGGGGNAGTPSGEGTQASPYNVAAAIAAVANLTWTSTTDYQTTNEVYVKGKISRIAENGTFSQSGTFGNATFYISDDGTQNGEFYVFRALYLGNAKYASGTDIKVGDEVIIYGKLMNYRGNTPETVSNSCYLYSLNGTTAGGSSSGGEQGGSQGGEQGGSGTTPGNNDGTQGGGEQGGGEQGGSESTTGASVLLSNAEILAAVHDESVTGDYATYGNVTIKSTSGEWTGNIARHPSKVNFIQLRNQQAAQLTSPVFSSNIDKIVFTMSDDESVSLSDRTLHAIPVGTTLPTAKDEKYTSTVWASEYGSVKTGTTKGASVTLTITGDTKQFMLVVEGGATYIKEIAVYLK